MSNDTVITIVGNLTADPEFKVFDSGARVANFTIASTPRTYDKQAGQWRDGEPLFLRCNLWNDYAEHATDTLAKGMAVIATGRLRQRNYTDRENTKRTMFELDVEEIGPSLRWATAKVAKAPRPGGGFDSGRAQRSSSAPANEWATVGAPAGGGWGAEPTGEPPF